MTIAALARQLRRGGYSDRNGWIVILGGFAAASLVRALVLQPAHQRLGSPPEGTAYEMSLILLISAMSDAVARVAVLASRASIGVAAIRPGERADAESLLHRADAEMYRSKRPRSSRLAPATHAPSPNPPSGTPSEAAL